MKIAFSPEAVEQFSNWATTDKKIVRKILSLIKDTQRNPFSGIAKPEPLKHELQGCWSRRITDEHRLVYQFEKDSLIILSCQYHYD